MEDLSLSEAPPQKKHVFWDTQPVRHTDAVDGELWAPIEPDTPHDEVRAEPYTLPASFTWCDCNVDDEKEMMEIYNHLNENYVEDDDNMFRFDYSIPFLKWALKPPGFLREWHVGVRATASGKLVGFITAIPATVWVDKKEKRMVEINFLCVHKKLRHKRLAPVLIKEVTRRVHRQGIFQAAYTAGVVLPTPVASCRYFHRSLNPKKLIEVGFSRLQPRMTMARTIKFYATTDSHTPGLRIMEKKDLAQAHKLLLDYLRQFQYAGWFTVEEFAHWCLPIEGVVNSYVVEDPATKKITAFLSFYTLPSTIIGNKTYPTLKAAYSYYNVCPEGMWKQLMSDCLALAKADDFDVFNALDIFHNREWLKDLKFGIGDGHLQYYIYNYRCPTIDSPDVGLVLL